MGFLTDEEQRSLQIKNMVLHTVSDGPFLPQPARTVEQAEFFAERIRETDAAAVFGFDPKSQTKAQIERIAAGIDDFKLGAQNLAREFPRFHDGTSRKGAFFTFELETEVANSRIFSLIKYDYEEVVEQTDGSQDTLLRLDVAHCSKLHAAGKHSSGVCGVPRCAASRAFLGPGTSDVDPSCIGWEWPC